MGEVGDEAQAEGEVFGEVAAAEVGHPAVAAGLHGGEYGGEGGYRADLEGQGVCVGLTVVFKYRGYGLARYAEVGGEGHELAVHGGQQFRGVVGPFGVEECLPGADFSVVSAPHRVEARRVEYGVAVGERCLVEVVEELYGGREEALQHEAHAFGVGVFHGYFQQGLVAEQASGGAIFVVAGDIGDALEAEEWRAGVERAVGGEEEACARDDCSYEGIGCEPGFDAAEGVFNQIAGEAEEHHFGSAECHFGVGRYA